MNLRRDITNPRLLFLKGWLFLILGAMAGLALVMAAPSWQNMALLVLCVWAFCRWYYFMFYVIEHYADPGFKFAGLGSFLLYAWRRRAGSGVSK